LLWRTAELADLERWTRSAATIALGDPEAPFVAASRRAVHRRAWARASAGVLAMTAVFGAFAYRAALQTRQAERIADISITTAEVEQGRQALLHDETGEARAHLGEAWRRGERSPATAFMLDRATQPQRAELARMAAVRGRMWSAAWSPDGRQVVTGDDAAAQVWDSATGRQLAVLSHEDTVYAAAWSGDQIVTASGDGTVRVWDAASGRELHRMTSPGRRYFRLAVSSSGMIAAMDASGRVAEAWTADGAPLATLANDGADFPVLAFSPDGRWLATTGGDEVHVWDTTSWKPTTLPVRRVHALAWAPAGGRLLTGSMDGDASIWDGAGAARIHQLRQSGEEVDLVA
jgi:hypothetical protein